MLLGLGIFIVAAVLLSPFLGIFIILAKSITLRGTHSQCQRSEPRFADADHEPGGGLLGNRGRERGAGEGERAVVHSPFSIIQNEILHWTGRR